MTTREGIVIMGCGGFALEVADWLDPNRYGAVGFYDDNTDLDPYGEACIKDLSLYEYWSFVVAVGNPTARKALWDKAIAHGLNPCLPIIHPSVISGSDNIVGRGSIICPGVIMTTKVEIGKNTVVNIASTIGHEAKIGDHVVISPAANISGRVNVEEGAYLGTNCSIREGLKIGKGAVIGMGTPIVKNVDDGLTMVGVKAVVLTDRPAVPLNLVQPTSQGEKQ